MQETSRIEEDEDEDEDEDENENDVAGVERLAVETDGTEEEAADILEEALWMEVEEEDE